jgi:molybdenum cofactor guanylyltransferase
VSAGAALGVVLAGGASRRMGCDKALIELDGETLLDRARRLLRATECAHLCVMGRSDVGDGLEDREPGAGPGRALHDALAHARALELDGVLAVPVDMPCLTPAHLAPLCAAPNRLARTWTGTPLPAWLPVGHGEIGRERVGSVRSLLDAGPHERLDPGARLSKGLVNINTPEALAQLRKPS